MFRIVFAEAFWRGIDEYIYFKVVVLRFGDECLMDDRFVICHLRGRA